MEKKSLSAPAEQPSASPQEAAANPAAAAASAAPPFDNTIHVEGILDIDATKGATASCSTW